MRARLSVLFFFFFQAEDGIRDHCVTGVQTCALPISASPGPPPPLLAQQPRQGQELRQGPGLPPEQAWTPPAGRRQATRPAYRCRRSEERRVGKGCGPRKATEEQSTTRTKLRTADKSR